MVFALIASCRARGSAFRIGTLEQMPCTTQSPNIMDTTRLTNRITDLAAMERPRERLVQLGPQALTTAELLAIRELYHGSLNASLVRVGEVFKPAIRRNAAAILAAQPSQRRPYPFSSYMWPSLGRWSRPGSCWISPYWTVRREVLHSRAP